jgi:hypothetical protein
LDALSGDAYYSKETERLPAAKYFAAIILLQVYVPLELVRAVSVALLLLLLASFYAHK